MEEKKLKDYVARAVAWEAIQRKTVEYYAQLWKEEYERHLERDFEELCEQMKKHDLDTIIKIITEETTLTTDYLYDNADVYNYIELNGLYPQQVDDFLSLFTFNPETLERIEKRIIEEADIEKNNNLEKADNIQTDISTLEALLNDKLFSQEAISGLQELIQNLRNQ